MDIQCDGERARKKRGGRHAEGDPDGVSENFVKQKSREREQRGRRKREREQRGGRKCKKRDRKRGV